MQKAIRQTHESDAPYVSTYNFIEQPHGFRVEGADRTPVTVEQHPRHLAVCYANRWTGQAESRLFGFYEFYDFSQQIAEVLMQDWKPLPQPHYRREERWLYKWVRTQTARALRTRIHQQWQRLLQQVDPTVLAVHRAIFAATLGCSPLALRAEFYQEPYLVHDITSYRAAAMATRLTCGDTGWAGFRTDWRRAHLVEAAPELLRNWLGFFSPDLKPYPSLNKTLMQLPGGVPYGLIGNLSGLYMPRPLVQRTELIVVTYLAERRVPTPNRRVFLQARAPHIKEAMRRVAAHTHNDLSPRRTGDLMCVVNFLADYPEVHQRNLVGLAKKSIRWHREGADRQIAAQLAELGSQTPTARPPIPLPETPGITFLDTVDAVCEEGTTMRHCVASYAQGAVDGRHYLFHVTHAGEQATVMVDAYTSQVWQAHGPGNQQNDAVAWGRRALQRWVRHW